MNDLVRTAALNISDLNNPALIEEGRAALDRLHTYVFEADAAITALRLELEGQPCMERIVARLDDIEQHLAELPAHGENRARACIDELGLRLLAARATLEECKAVAA